MTVADFGALRGDQDVATQEKLEPARHGGAVDGTDDRYRQRFQLGENALIEGDGFDQLRRAVLQLLAKFQQIAAG
jgi:hypothetical protein